MVWQIQKTRHLLTKGFETSLKIICYLSNFSIICGNNSILTPYIYSIDNVWLNCLRLMVHSLFRFRATFVRHIIPAVNLSEKICDYFLLVKCIKIYKYRLNRKLFYYCSNSTQTYALHVYLQDFSI